MRNRKKISQVLMSAIFVASLSSCAVHHGSISNSVIEKPVKYEDIATGVSQTNKYFGFGGVAKDALVYDAKRQLTKSRFLKPQEQYANYTVDLKYSNWLVYQQIKVTVVADVVRIIDNTAEEIYSQEYLKKISTVSFKNNLFEIGDSIIFKKSIMGTIVSMDDNKKVRIAYQTEKGNTRSKRTSVYKLYAINKSYKGFNASGFYAYTPAYANGKQINAPIVGVGLESLLIKDYFKGITSVQYPIE